MQNEAVGAKSLQSQMAIPHIKMKVEANKVRLHDPQKHRGLMYRQKQNILVVHTESVE